MKRILYLIVILAGVVGFYEQTSPEPNPWISALSIAVFMLGLLFLSQKATRNSPSNSENHEDNK